MFRRAWNLMFLLVALCGSSALLAAQSPTATVTMGGSEQSVSGVWDAGSVTLSFNGYNETFPYGQYSTPASIASALAAKFTHDFSYQGLWAQAGASGAAGPTNKNPAVITFLLLNGETFGQLVYTLPATSFNVSSAGFVSSGPVLPPTGTTTTISLSPSVSYQGYPVLIDVMVSGPNGSVPSSGGTVSCTATLPSGQTLIPSQVTLNGLTSLAQLVLTGLPLTPSATYSVSCSFVSSNPALFTSSSSVTPATGMVITPQNPLNIPAGTLAVPRSGHQTTPLIDGTLLVTGGTDNGQILSTSEIYAAGAFSLGNQMTSPRVGHRATALASSTQQVLITGGSDGTGAIATAELYTPGSGAGVAGTFSPTAAYDPSTGTFTASGTQMNSPREYHTATLLPNGQVLITGGQGSNGTSLASAEIYNPLTGVFTLTSAMNSARSQHTATLLTDGTVLIAGGLDSNGSPLNSAEIYNPALGQFIVVGSMLTTRTAAQATLLGDGTVLFTGGTTSATNAEIYRSKAFYQTVDVATGTATAMSVGRQNHTATMLYDGTVLIAGGTSTSSGQVTGVEEIYNLRTGDFTAAGNMTWPRSQHTATLLPNDNVLLIGGASGPTSLNTAEVYASTSMTSGLHPKFFVLSVMYPPPGSGSTMTYTGQTAIGSTTSTTNSFTNALTLSTQFMTVPIGPQPSTKDPVYPQAPYTDFEQPTGEFDYSYELSGTASYSLTTTATDATVVTGPSMSQLGVDHEADILWVWLNPETDYTVAAQNALVWNGYSTNTADTNVLPGQLDIVPLTVSQLDGTSAIPPDLQYILDRNWDPIANGGAGGLTPADLLTLLKRDPFAITFVPKTAATQPTNTAVAPPPSTTLFDPNIPTVDPATNTCGNRYNFDPVNGQSFSFGQLGAQNQAVTSSYSLLSGNSQNWSQTTTDTYSVGISANFTKFSTILNSLKASDTLTFVNTWNPSTSNSTSTTQALSIKNPLSKDGYTGPSQMQVWQDNMYQTYMFYPKPTDTAINLSSSAWSGAFNTPITLTATITPDPTEQAKVNASPTGTITFYDGCTILGVATINGGVATLNYTWTPATGSITTEARAILPPGSPTPPPIPPPPTINFYNHTIRALYSGDANYFHNTGNTLTEILSSTLFPDLTSLAPTSGSIGTSVTLTGVNLGTGAGIVQFNGIAATVTSWSATSVVAIVPPGAATGPVTISSSAGLVGNSLPFTVTNTISQSTISTLVLSPTQTWSGYPIVANVQVTSAAALPPGSVSCLSSPSTGKASVAVLVNTATGIAQVQILDAPVVPTGSLTPLTYQESCKFTPTGGLPAAAISQSNSVTGTVTPVPAATTVAQLPLLIPRENHQTTVLNDGTVLVTGGDSGHYAIDGTENPEYLDSSEIFANGAFTLGSEMTQVRSMHQATLLSNGSGQVLITGGMDGGNALASAELYTPGPVADAPGTFNPTTLYDPAAQGFTTTVTNMNTPRFWHTATLLPSGKVLITGGTNSLGDFPSKQPGYQVTAGTNQTPGNAVQTAELYDPTTGNFTYTSGTMTAARTRHTATLLTDGTVLITGGMDPVGNALNSAEIYNPATDTFTKTAGVMSGFRIRAQATRLGNGTVLITGGSVSSATCPGFGVNNCPVATAEIYNPANGTFTPTGSMKLPRYSHTATVLPDGTVLIAGGYTDWYQVGSDTKVTAAGSAESYNPANGTFSITALLSAARFNHTATPLGNGDVLLVGGAGGDDVGALPLGYPGSGNQSSVEMYMPPMQPAALHPKFMVLNVMYAPPGSGSSVTYTDSTIMGSSMTATQMKSNALTLTLGGTIGIATISATGGYTFAQDSATSYGVNTTLTDATQVLGPSETIAGSATTGSGLGVDHEADVLWVWLNPESDFTIPSATSLIWTGYATNTADPYVATGQMDIVPLTVAQLDAPNTIPTDVLERLNRDWDPVSGGGAGPITATDLITILQRDPFAVNLSGTGQATALTNVPLAPTTTYPIFDPNVPTHDPNNPDTTQCAQRFRFDPKTGQTIQYATLGGTNQALSQSYSLQTNMTNMGTSTTTDSYYVGLSLGFCFGVGGKCNGSTGAGASATISFSVGDKYTWGLKSGSMTNAQSLQMQALTIKNPLPIDLYTGPVQMQVWKDAIYGTYMFYPRPTDTVVTSATSQSATQAGDSVTISAIVTPDPTFIASPPTPTGNVTFYDGCNAIGTAQKLTNGRASVTTSWSSAGTHSILAVYSGDTVYFHNDATPLSQTVVSATSPVAYLIGLNPGSGNIGSSVVISGSNLGTSGVVTFNGVPAKTTAWSAGSITATVPTGATSGPIVVVSGTTTSNGVGFTVTVPATSTTTTLTLSPAASTSGRPVDGHVAVTGPAGIALQGTVSCVQSSTAGTFTTPSLALNSTTSSADVLLTGLPTIPSGSTSTGTFTSQCTFTSGSGSYTGSSSNIAAGTVTAVPSPTSSPTTGLNVARDNAQSVLLPDGTVLVTGGDAAGVAIAQSEIFMGNAFTLAAPMSVARTGHQATLLSNSTGQVLVTGGTDGQGDTFASAELFTPGPIPADPGSFNPATLFDPATQTFTSTASAMNVERSQHMATQLPGGKVLITGGLDAYGDVLSSAELYDPVAGSFTYTSGSLSTARYGHNATLLANGTVLISGGTGVSGSPTNVAEIYNPALDTFAVTQTTTGAPTFMISARAEAQATLLGGGNVLITGGTSGGAALTGAEIYTPATGVFTSTKDASGPTTMKAARALHTATLLADGTVLVAGGISSTGAALSSEEIFDPGTGDFTLLTTKMVVARFDQSATLISSGNVLLAGGLTTGTSLTAAEIFSSPLSSTELFPKFMVLDVLYAPPGAGSNVTYTNATAVGTTTSTDATFSSEEAVSIKATIAIAPGFTISPEFDWGHTFTQDNTSSFMFTTTTTNTTVVPGAVALGTEGTPTPISTGVDHEADIVQVWLNPATIYTIPASPTDPLVWNGLSSNSLDPNVAPGAMDVVSLTISQLDGTSPIPEELQAVLDRNWDAGASGGAGGLIATDFKTIMQRDPFVTNTLLNHMTATPNSPTSFFDPNIPVADPLAQTPNQCSTRFSFDPVLGQSVPFGQLGSTNQAQTQTYNLMSSTSNAKGSTTTDQYSVAQSEQVGFNLGIVAFTFMNANTFTWTNKMGLIKTNTATSTQILSIKNPLASDNYTGPTQMQVWQDKIYGTFMFYPKATDTYVTVASSESTSGPTDSIDLTAIIHPDPRLVASTNPPLVLSGSVNFYDGCTLLNPTPVTVVNGTAVLTVPALALGTHSILASYTGDTHFLHNISEPLTQSVVASTAAAPYITGLSVATGPVGTPVVISGINFGTSGTVTFNGISASASAWSASSINVTVPTGATSGAVFVTSGAVPSNGLPFIVTQPTGKTSVSVILSPTTSLSGYPVAASVMVTGAANTTPTGSVSCVVAASGFAGSTSATTALVAGAAQVSIPTLPLVVANGAPAPFTVTCSFTGTGGFANSQSAATPGTVIPVPNAVEAASGSLAFARENHQAGLLGDGTLLVTGGDSAGAALYSAELYNNGTFSSAGNMIYPRTFHQQTDLINATGQVLITGGSDGTYSSESAELYTPAQIPGMPGTFSRTTEFDPQTQSFSNIQTYMTGPRMNHTATRLNTGKILIAGGTDQSGNALASAELYDPAKGTFTPTVGSMTYARTGQNATLLLDGTVLLSGGANTSGTPLASAEIYNPATNTFALTKTSSGASTQLEKARISSVATRLGSGKVLISGGQDGAGNGFNTAEIYDPSSGTFTYTETPAGLLSNMTASRFNHTASLLYDGTVLLAGGQSNNTTTLSSMEIYNPTTGVFYSAGALLESPRHSQTATVFPSIGVLLIGGSNTTTGGSTIESSSELFSPFEILAGLHPKYMVVNIQYAPPGSGSAMTYMDATSIGSSTGTENSFVHQESIAAQVGVNFGLFKISETTTNTWTDTQDSTDTFTLSNQTTQSEVVPGPKSSSLGVEHESDVIWLWLNPVADYTITSPNTFVWNGFTTDPDDPNSLSDGMDVIPLSVSQLDGNSPISQAEWDVLDRNWDPLTSGGAGPITTADFTTILERDPFATNLSGVGRATAPTTTPNGNLYPIFDPNLPTWDPQTQQCGNRYDFSPGFSMTFPFTQLGSVNQAITQTYQLESKAAQVMSSTTTDTYKVTLSGNFTWNELWRFGPPVPVVPPANPTPAEVSAAFAKANATNVFNLGLKISGSLQWTNKWTTMKNSANTQTQLLSIKNPLVSDMYTGPEQIEVWKDNLFGTFMFYPKPTDTSWMLYASQISTNPSGGPVTLTASVTPDPNFLSIPSGIVSFYEGCNSLGTAEINPATGTASIATPALSNGQHTVQAFYSGDPTFFHNNVAPITFSVPAGSSPAPPGNVCTVVPTVPMGLTAGGTTSAKTTLTWAASTTGTNCSLVDYTVYESGAAIGTAATTTFTVTGLSPSTTYQFAIAANDAAGASAPGTPVTITTPACTSNCSAPLGTGVFAPYIFMGFAQDANLPLIQQQSGVNAMTLAFLTAFQGTCSAAWSDLNAALPQDTLPNQTTIQSLVQQLQAAGTKVIISFGGAVGEDPAAACTTAASLQAVYQSVITRYNVTMLDFDIEGSAVTNQAAVTRRDQALVALKAANPGLIISYSIPAYPTGLPTAGVDLLNSVKSDGLALDVVNLLAMDYGPNVKSNEMGANAIAAAQSAYAQVQTAGLSSTLGLTVEIGQNLPTNEVFQLYDVPTVVNFATNNPYVTRLSMWSMGRDNDSCGTNSTLSGYCSGILQTNWQFSQAFEIF